MTKPEKVEKKPELFVLFTMSHPGMQILGMVDTVNGQLVVDEGGYSIIHNPFLVVGHKVEEGRVGKPDGAPAGATVGIALQPPSPFTLGQPLQAVVTGFSGPIKDSKLGAAYKRQVDEMRFRASGLIHP